MKKILVGTVVLVIAGIIGTALGFGTPLGTVVKYASDPMYRDVVDMERKYEWLDMANLSYTSNRNLVVMLVIRSGHSATSESFQAAFFDAVDLIDKHIADDAAGAFLWLCAADQRGRMVAYYVYHGEGRNIRTEGANEKTLPLIYKNMGPVAIVRMGTGWVVSSIYVMDPDRAPYYGREPLSDL